MRRDEALRILRAHEAELRASGVVRLRLFGSVARDEAGEGSDVDVLVDFTPEHKVTLWDLGGVQQQLVELLACDVDLTRESKLRDKVRPHAIREAVLAF
jgi:predicted nucleotidyltransferase